MSNVFLTNSRNGISVYYDPLNSHAATHIKDTPELVALAAEVISELDLEEDFLQVHKDLGRIVGTSDLVEVDAGDELIYAKRLNRDNFSVFSKTKGPEPSSLVTIAVEKRDSEQYELVSCWIGPSDSPSFPGTERETAESKPFWAKHALAWGRQEIQPGTETSRCPW